MKRALTATLAALLMMTLAGSGATPASQSTGLTKTSWDDYRLILSRNIFSRTRTAPGREPRGGFGRTPRTTVESFLVLRGVGMQDNLRIAFLEDTRGGQSYRVAAGKALGGGVIRSVTLDGVEYVQDGVTRNVKVGETLTGVPAGNGASPFPPTSSGPDLTAAASQAAQPASGPSSVNDLIERMRLRRLQETKQ